MKDYISKKNKMSQLKFAIKYVIWTKEQWDSIHFSDESSLTCSVVTGEGSFAPEH